MINQNDDCDLDICEFDDSFFNKVEKLSIEENANRSDFTKIVENSMFREDDVDPDLVEEIDFSDQ